MSNLNSQNIIHRDLKTENILFNYNNNEDLLNQNIKKAQIKIIDFGFWRYLHNNEEANSILGNPLFMEPIILKSITKGNNYFHTSYDKKNRYFINYIITYYIIMGNLPFICHTCDNLFKIIQKENIFYLKYLNFLLLLKDI